MQLIKFMVMFRQPENIDEFENVYNDFLALMERIPDVKRRQVIDVLGSPSGKSPYYRILEVYFENREAMDAALLSERGQEAGKELARFGSDTIEIIFANTYEEEGGSTPL